MPYLNQADALVQEARRYFAHAELEAEQWPYCGSLLAWALEHAACAVFMAWGEPHAPEKKMHPSFDDRLAPVLSQGVVQFVQLVWEREGQGRPGAHVQQLLTACRRAIDYFTGLATNPPPAGWEPLPIPEPVGWDGLCDEEREFLLEAQAAAAQLIPGVRLVLFGSRATGTARPDSDYDFLFIFPDRTEDWLRGQSRGSASSLAMGLGIKLSIESASAEEWLNPPEVSRPLIERVKATGIEIPSSLPEVTL